MVKIIKCKGQILKSSVHYCYGAPLDIRLFIRQECEAKLSDLFDRNNIAFALRKKGKGNMYKSVDLENVREKH